MPQHVVVDKTSNPTLNHVIRRNPTVTSEVHYSPPLPPTTATTTMSFGNTSDNNGANVPNPDYGKKPEIVGPAIYVHSKGGMSVVTEQPAHVGWRSEKKVITSLNKETNKVEQHEINQHTPILGTIEKVEQLKSDTARRYDLGTKTWGAVSTSVSK
jgi:hypothetical protein